MKHPLQFCELLLGRQFRVAYVIFQRTILSPPPTPTKEKPTQPHPRYPKTMLGSKFPPEVAHVGQSFAAFFPNIRPAGGHD
jgi:hypothetical protein